MTTNKMIIMVGISGSGKSSAAKILQKEYDAEILSSDEIREEMGDVNCQTRNVEVFNTLTKRLNQNLTQGKNVIIDATNLSIKNRKQYLVAARKYNYDTIAYITNKPIEQCMKDNVGRDRVVPDYVINKQVLNFQIPFYDEGFDEINFHYSNHDIDKVNEFRELFHQMNGFDQENPYHNENLLEHSKSVYNHLLNEEDCPETLLIAAKYHDIGKLKTKTFDENNIAHYYGHDSYGSYLVSSLLTPQAVKLTKEEFLDICFYVNYHMIPFSITMPKTERKYESIFGKEKYNNLCELPPLRIFDS